MAIVPTTTEMATNDLAISPRPEASLLGLSSELRLEIFKHLFHPYLSRELFTIWDVYSEAYNQRPFSIHRHNPDNYLGILRTCKLFHEEAMELLYSHLDPTVCIMDNPEPPMDPHDLISGRPETMRLWYFARRMTLCAFLHPGKWNGQLVVERLRNFVQNALSGGRRLKELKICLTSADDEKMPRYLGQVLDALSELRVDGRVRVEIDYDQYGEEWAGYGKECVALERTIRGRSKNSATLHGDQTPK
ncbi:uncharacterized protein LTR77_000181 [Saxophila tyrrhenica]|uniref:Uncharacterized protein n=1 Tax=Saxophila tyrrhenica TaxID=1690608 RepID=A0AAV9PQJ5_9PEZI|nr:hypothetical protein LTR77_000181 [Saxophila tyrrhenica]